MDILSPYQKQWWQVMLSYLMKCTMCIILLTKHQRLFSICCFLGLCKIIRILYSLINVINQFCVIFGIAFNVGSLNCCQTNYSPLWQYIIFLSYLVTIQNISKGTEIHCAVHYTRTSVFPHCIHDHLQKRVVQDHDFT